MLSRVYSSDAKGTQWEWHFKLLQYANGMQLLLDVMTEVMPVLSQFNESVGNMLQLQAGCGACLELCCGCRQMLTSMSLLAGAVLVIIIVFMAVTSSGASEMVAVSSLFTFDVYRRYINSKVRLKPYPSIMCLHHDGVWADLFPPCIPADRLCQAFRRG